jgi:hypothetical protein
VRKRKPLRIIGPLNQEISDSSLCKDSSKNNDLDENTTFLIIKKTVQIGINRDLTKLLKNMVRDKSLFENPTTPNN